MTLHEQLMTRQDERPCDCCGRLIEAGDVVLYNLEHGTVYCTQACAENEHFRPEASRRAEVSPSGKARQRVSVQSGPRD